MSKLITANAVVGGKVDKRGKALRPTELSASNHMTARSAAAARARTGGPREDGPKILEHALGWVLVAVVAMFVTRLGLL